MVGLSVLIGILMLLESLFLLSPFIQYTQIFTTFSRSKLSALRSCSFSQFFDFHPSREKAFLIQSPVQSFDSYQSDIALAVGFTTFGLPGLFRLFLPTILIALYAALCSLINDFLKVLYLTKKAHPPE